MTSMYNASNSVLPFTALRMNGMIPDKTHSVRSLFLCIVLLAFVLPVFPNLVLKGAR